MMINDGGLKKVRITAPHAEAVYLMARFNNWSTTANAMSRIGRDVWEACVPMGKCLGEFCFILFEKGCPFGRIEHPCLALKPEDSNAPESVSVMSPVER